MVQIQGAGLPPARPRVCTLALHELRAMAHTYSPSVSGVDEERQEVQRHLELDTKSEASHRYSR